MAKIRSIKEITLQIKGRDWTFKLINDSVFNKHHNNDDGDCAGITLPRSYECHFRRSDWTTIDIRHELGHVFHTMSLTNSSDISPSQTEELMCEIIGNCLPEIALLTDRIVEKFQGE